MPPGMGYPEDQRTDQFGRPRVVNLSTITSYYKDNILAVDRLMLPESNRLHPLFPFQRLIIEEIAAKDFLFLQMMRGGGKTYTVARGLLDYALQNANVPIIFSGPSFRQSLLAYDEVLRILQINKKNENVPVKVEFEVFGDPKRNATESILHFHNGSSIRALPMGDGSKIRGIRGGVLWLDEGYQITEEQYESHVSPFVAVRQGNRDSKIIISTTSWYQDCYAYRRLLQIATKVREGNPKYGILDFNLQDLNKCKFPLSESVWQDAMEFQDPVTTAMTYFNIWPSSAGRWFEQKNIDFAISKERRVPVWMKREEGSQDKLFAVIDLAASDKGDSTEVVVFRFRKTKDTPEPFIEIVYAYERQGLKSQERALLVHEINAKFQPEFIIYDSHAAIGIDLRSDLAQREILDKGTVKKFLPLLHHDKFGQSGQHILIPVAPHDKAVEKALVGPRGGESIRGEAGLRELLMTKARDLLANGLIRGPGSNSDTDSLTMAEIESRDTAREAFQQLGNIGLKRNAQQEVMYSQDNRLLFTTRPGQHDDGAMCIIYAVIGYYRLLGRGAIDPSSNPIQRAMLPDGNSLGYLHSGNHQKIVI
jgi:hypothetical protein